MATEIRKDWDEVPGLFHWPDVAAMIELKQPRQVHAVRVRTDASGLALYRVHVSQLSAPPLGASQLIDLRRHAAKRRLRTHAA
jgi:hypothetical protein